MADRNSSKVERLPIKIIMPEQGTEKRVPTGGSSPKPFREVDDAYRQSFADRVSAIQDAMQTQMKQTNVAPLRVKLLSNAVAKSHRPDTLFSSSTCPIVSAGHLGELFVKATPDGLKNLKKEIETNRTKQVIKELSCVETIEAITPAFRRNHVEPNDVLRQSPRGKEGFMTRVRLFNFGADKDQTKLITNFEDLCTQRGINISSEAYSPASMVYSAECRSTEDVIALSSVVGVRSVTGMPLIRIVRPQMLNAKALPKLLSRPEVSGTIPVVAVVDSGVSDKIPELESWVVGRETYVAPPYRNTDHGTFVAGLICWGGDLNPTVDGIDSNPCGILDVQILPNDDPSKGDTEFISEPEFLVALKAALQDHSNEHKVWNLSLNTNIVCSLDEFSVLAEELDNLQEKYEVSFVISAGNYTKSPLLDYPRLTPQLEEGRITTPADSVLGITVGSISHVDYKKNGPEEHQPSAFSRHGAGPNHVIKPDLVHYGGSCSIDATHITGIRSVDGNGSSENLGTSFAAPLVSRTLAQIYHQVTPTPKPVLARALLTHHARDPRTGHRVPDGEENFLGFGRPSPVPYCLECTPYSSTLVFDDQLRPGYFLEWNDFPYPPSLYRDGRFFGEIWMTVAFAPARGARWGNEYCETHIDAKFGVYRDRLNRTTGKITTPFKGLVPPEHRRPGELYESYQIKELRKWAPVRTYHGDLGKKGERGNKWRLKVQLLTRHGIEKVESFKPQPFSLIVTISDPEKKALVYDEMARTVLSRFEAENLVVRASARIRADIEETNN